MVCSVTVWVCLSKTAETAVVTISWETWGRAETWETTSTRVSLVWGVWAVTISVLPLPLTPLPLHHGRECQTYYLYPSCPPPLLPLFLLLLLPLVAPTPALPPSPPSSPSAPPRSLPHRGIMSAMKERGETRTSRGASFLCDVMRCNLWSPPLPIPLSGYCSMSILFFPVISLFLFLSLSLSPTLPTFILFYFILFHYSAAWS